MESIPEDMKVKDVQWGEDLEKAQGEAQKKIWARRYL